jgi:asparagine synthase (glutamine-hydrolysing)
MSGIAAIFNLDGRPAERATVERMLGAIPYRARDGSGIWSEGPVALGHAMLHTTPESLHEHQPLLDETGQFCLTLDGRVDNRAELRDALLAAGSRLRDDTDAELVLRAYQAWGEDAPRRILGDFAFAIWDGSRRRLFCARDWVGVSPLYYFSDGRTFICGSELHQLFEDPRVPHEPNEGMIGEYLCDRPTNLEETLYRGVMRLVPAHLMLVDSAGIKIRRYYAPDPARALRLADDREYAEQFKSLFFESVRCRLRSSGRIISDLSGGLDSSSITCVAQSILRESGADAPPLEAVSVMFAHPESDEREYARAAAETSGVRWTQLAPRIRPLQETVSQVAHYRNLPDAPNTGYAAYEELLMARGDVRVWLKGMAGDHLLTYGSLDYLEMLVDLRLRALWREVRGDLRRWRGGDEWSNPFDRALACAWAILPAGMRRVLRGYLRRAAAPAFIDAGFASRNRLAARIRPFPREPRFRRYAAVEVFRAFTHGSLADAIESVSRMTARFGAEARYPFLDRRLFEFALALPVEQRSRDGVTKVVLREAMRGILPELVRTRATKVVFDWVYAEALLQFGEPFFESLAIASAGWVAGDEVAHNFRAYRRMYLDGDPNYCACQFGWWAVATMEMWFNLACGRLEAGAVLRRCLAPAAEPKAARVAPSDCLPRRTAGAEHSLS